LISHVKDRAGHDRRYAINTTKIKNDLGFLPEESFETGIRKTLRWFLDHQPWWNDLLNDSYKAWLATNYS
jgi:dTDP-glucose 4,6-dehydratase